MIVVTLTKNSSKTISETIKSLEKQTLQNIFWLVLDDDSKDNTLGLVRHSKIKHEIVKVNSKSLFSAYNKALKNLNQKKLDDIIFFLHSDDLIYDKNTLQLVNDIFNKNKISSLIGNIVYFKNDQSKFFRLWKSNFKRKQRQIDKRLYKFSSFLKKDLLFGWSFPHTSFFFHSDILKDIPDYDDNFKTSSDYGWSVEIMLQNKFSIHYLDEFVIKMKSGGTSTNLSNIFIQFFNDFQIIKKYFFKSYLDIFFCFIVLFFKKFRKIRQFF